METCTFKILEDVAFLEGQGLLLLLIQHAVHGDELVVQGDDVREADSRPDHILRPANRCPLRDPSHSGKHAWENRKVSAYAFLWAPNVRFQRMEAWAGTMSVSC